MHQGVASSRADKPRQLALYRAQGGERYVCGSTCQRQPPHGGCCLAAFLLQMVVACRVLAAEDGPDKATITNVVFMGMGEPLDNLDSVMAAVDIMTHPLGLHMSRYKVCGALAFGCRGVSMQQDGSALHNSCCCMIGGLHCWLLGQGLSWDCHLGEVAGTANVARALQCSCLSGGACMIIPTKALEYEA